MFIKYKNENLLKLYSPSVHLRCRWVCFFMERKKSINQSINQLLRRSNFKLSLLIKIPVHYLPNLKFTIIFFYSCSGQISLDLCIFLSSIQTLIVELELCGLHVDYCDVFINYLLTF